VDGGADNDTLDASEATDNISINLAADQNFYEL